MRPLVWLVLVAVGSACSTGSSPSSQVTVFAAASLSDAFETIGAEFEAAHPGVDVILNFAGSQTLATQILEGASADVFASADSVQMERVLSGSSLTARPSVFARNRMSIVVAGGNPHRISGLMDLERSGLKVVLGAPEVPVGRYAAAVLARAGVSVSAASLEADVRSVLAKVALGEADVGIVYRSDVATSGGDVEAVAIPPEVNIVAEYPIVAINQDSDIAQEFVEFVLSKRAAAHLAEAGLDT